MNGVSMKLYLISIECAGTHHHPNVDSHLRALNAEQVMDRQWAVRSSFTATQLKERFRRFLDDQDRIVVVEVGEEKASRRARADIRKL